jgi:hypothetical protein
MNEGEFYKQFLQEWKDTNDYVFSREQVGKLLEAGRIGKDKAEYLLRLRYEYTHHTDKLQVRDEKDCLVDIAEIRYYLALL